MRVERLERVAADELRKREESEQYIKHMLENLRSQMKEGFESDTVTDKEMEVRLAGSIDKHNSRLTRIELSISLALGSLLIVGWLVNHSADKILLLLAK